MGLTEETRVGNDETRLGKIAGGYGGLTHLWMREAWNQAAGRFQVAGVAKSYQRGPFPSREILRGSKMSR